MIKFEDFNLILYIYMFNTTIEVIMKNTLFKQHFIMSFKPLTKTNHGFGVPEHYFGPLCHACPQLLTKCFFIQLFVIHDNISS
jgi:hypothetical protein